MLIADLNHLEITKQLRHHAPYTAIGAAAGIALMVLLLAIGISHDASHRLFMVLHPLHVLLSAVATASVYRRYGNGKLVPTILIGYFGSIGIATLSDAVIPFIGESLLQLPQAHVHFGFIELWWLVHPAAFIGIAIAWFHPRAHLAHAGHVLLSTGASLFHMMMALGGSASPGTVAALAVFLFLAVWLPCCTSDIVFPLLWVKRDPGTAEQPAALG